MALLQYFNQGLIECGLDESGRGCLAGPVVAAAVILKKDFYHPLLNDSKKVSAENRQILKSFIIDNALAFSVQSIDNNTIDKINILQASILAMHNCLEQLALQPDLLLIDGNYFKPFQHIPHHCIVKGDSKFSCIAAASILAKTYRDEYMEQLHEDFPSYNWNKNKGYGTKKHVAALQEYGTTIYHRKSFHFPQKQ